MKSGTNSAGDGPNRQVVVSAAGANKMGILPLKCFATGWIITSINLFFLGIINSCARFGEMPTRTVDSAKELIKYKVIK
jgi:hypothetical protein